MPEQSTLAEFGFRLGLLGSAASLAIAAPLANGNYSTAAHTDASRIGAYYQRGGDPLMGFVANGVDSAHIAPFGVEVQNGSIAAPSLTFFGDRTTGLHLPGASQLGVAVNGQERARWYADGGLEFSASGQFTNSSQGPNFANFVSNVGNVGGILVTNLANNGVSGLVMTSGSAAQIGHANSAYSPSGPIEQPSQMFLYTQAANGLALLIDSTTAPIRIGNYLNEWARFYNDGGVQIGGVFGTAPGQNNLYVAGVITTGYGSAAAPAYTFTADVALGLYRVSANTMGVVTAGVERMRFYSDGGIQIGGTYSTSPGVGALWVTSNVNALQFRIPASVTSTVPGSINDDSRIYTINNGDMIFHTRSNGGNKQFQWYGSAATNTSVLTMTLTGDGALTTRSDIRAGTIATGAKILLGDGYITKSTGSNMVVSGALQDVGGALYVKQGDAFSAGGNNITARNYIFGWGASGPADGGHFYPDSGTKRMSIYADAAQSVETIRFYADAGVQIGGTYGTSPGAGILSVNRSAASSAIQVVNETNTAGYFAGVELRNAAGADYGKMTFRTYSAATSSNLYGISLANASVISTGYGGTGIGGHLFLGTDIVWSNIYFGTFNTLRAVISRSGGLYVGSSFSEPGDGSILAAAGITAGTKFLAPLGATGTPSYTFTADATTGIYMPSAGTLAVTIGGTTRMNFYASGAVSCGFGDAGSAGYFASSKLRVGYSTFRYLDVVDDGAGVSMGANGTAVGASAGLYLYSVSSTPVRFGTNGSERMRVWGDGGILISDTYAASPGAGFVTLSYTQNSINTITANNPRSTSGVSATSVGGRLTASASAAGVNISAYGPYYTLTTGFGGASLASNVEISAGAATMNYVAGVHSWGIGTTEGMRMGTNGGLQLGVFTTNPSLGQIQTPSYGWLRVGLTTDVTHAEYGSGAINLTSTTVGCYANVRSNFGAGEARYGAQSNTGYVGLHCFGSTNTQTIAGLAVAGMGGLWNLGISTDIFIAAEGRALHFCTNAEAARVYADGGVQIGGTYGASPGAGALKCGDTTWLNYSANYPFYAQADASGTLYGVRIVNTSATLNGSARLSAVNDVGTTASLWVYSSTGGSTLDGQDVGNLGVVGATRDFLIRTNGNYALHFGTNLAERMRIWGDGGVQIGSTFTASPGAGCLSLDNDLLIGSAGWVYYGASGTDGSWRTGRSGNNLVAQRRESGVWVTKQTITP